MKYLVLLDRCLPRRAHIFRGGGKTVNTSFRHTLPLILLLATTQAAGAPVWEAGIGFAAINFPDYRGSAERSSYGAPIPFLVYRGKNIRIDRSGFKGRLYSGDRVRIDVSLDGSVPVNSATNGVRDAMPNLDPTIELGPSVELLLRGGSDLTVKLRLPLRAAIATDLSQAHHEGWLFNPHLSIDSRGRWNLGLSAGPLFASSRYHNYFYGVEPEYATDDRPSYEASGGYSGFRVGLSASRRTSDFWFGGFIRYDNLAFVAFSNSPLVISSESLMLGAGITWMLAKSRHSAGHF